MIFSIGFAVIVVVILCISYWVANRPAPAHNDGGVTIYKDQLKALERDVERGVVDASEAENLRIELSRRMLRAAKNANDTETDGNFQPSFLLGSSIAVMAVAFAGYFFIFGAPGYRDIPLQTRLDQAQDARQNLLPQSALEAQINREIVNYPDSESAQLVQDLRTAVQQRPDDQKGHELLMYEEAKLGNFGQARLAMQRVLDLKGDTATPDEMMAYIGLMLGASNGVYSKDAETTLLKVLNVDPDNKFARFSLGEFFAQTGRPDRTFSLWKALIEEGPETAPYMPTIRDNIIELADISGQTDYVPPEPPLDPDTQSEMITGMVEGLAERLATDGGTAAEWARLIRSLTVLGQLDRAEAIRTEAMNVFQNDQNALDLINQATSDLGSNN